MVSERGVFEVISVRLKIMITALIFLLLLILDIPEFIICTCTIPDEILDVPRMLPTRNLSDSGINAERLRAIIKMLESVPYLPTKKEAAHPRIMIVSGYAAEIKKHYLGEESGPRYEDTTQKGDAILYLQGKNRFITFINKSRQICAILRTSSLSILRI